jgi:CBS-domain-containing membrane protein
MFARDIMTPDVIWAYADDAVHDVIRRLAEFQISGMPVCDRQRRLVGIVTEADVLGHAGATVKDIMTHHVVTVTETTPVDHIAQLLTGKRIKRVPVMCGTQVVGIVSRADIVRMMASRWTCGVCGALHLGSMPSECDACGAPGHIFDRDFDPRTEITSR